METINVTKDEKERLEYFANINKTTVNNLILRLIEAHHLAANFYLPTLCLYKHLS